jgi:hypothetical protein
VVERPRERLVIDAIAAFGDHPEQATPPTVGSRQTSHP